MKTKLKGNILLLITAIIWGFAFVAQSVGVDLLSPSAFNGTRTLLGAAVLIPFVLPSARKTFKNTETKKNTIIGGIACGIILCLAGTIQTYGLKFSGTGKAGFITALYIIFVPLCNLFGGGKLTPKTTISVITATFGMYLLCGGNTFYMGKGEIVLLISSLLFTVHILAIDKFSPKADGVVMSFIQFTVSGSINVIYMLCFENPQISAILDAWLPILYAGAMSCGIAYTLQIIGQKYTDPTSASLIMSLESVFAVLGGWLLLDQKMNAKEIIGCAAMFAAIILIQLPSKKQEQKTDG